MFRLALIILLACSLIACASRIKDTEPARTSYIDQGKRDFQQGYYKKALHELLPYATDGDPEAQYAVGYMYYYGYGAAQDTSVGYFWITRSADQHYEPAMIAKRSIEHRAPPSKRKPYPSQLN